MTDHWFDDAAGPVVRPYAMTRGRTTSGSRKDAPFDLIALVIAEEPGGAEPAAADSRPHGDLYADSSLEPEHIDIVERCRRGPQSVAELAVALDLRLDDALRREGTARKLVRVLNDHRKATGLEIADRIRVELATTGTVLDAIVEHRDWIAGEVLAVGVGVTELADGDGGYDPFEIDGTSVGVRIDKV